MTSQNPRNVLPKKAVVLCVLAAFFAGAAFAVDDASVRITSVTPVGANTYDITGIAVDELVNPACTLALASGRCVFSCGPGSIRCEGGTADLPNGRFELFDLPTEEDGTLRLQVFIEGHVALVVPIAPEPPVDAGRWGVWNTYCCPSARSTLKVTIDGVMKKSINSTCSFDREWEPTWEGWSEAPRAPFEVEAESELESQTVVPDACNVYSEDFQSQVPPGTCYLYALRAVDGQPQLFEEEVDCATLP
jgi:hypothetical protein